jgi:biopolymer transport protein ExbB
MDMLFLQTTVGGDPVITEEKISLLSLLLKGGYFMIPIGALLAIAIYITIERFLTISKAGRVDKDFMRNIKDYVVNGKIAAARDLCQKNDTPAARMIDKGISRIGKPLDNIQVAIENVGKLEVFRLEKGLATLATISGAGPMIGFLGTVTGMINAFFEMANAGQNIDVSLLAGGIYEALITTVGGLIVGIVAFIAYNQLVSMVDKVVNKMEATSIEFIDLLQEPV